MGLSEKLTQIKSDAQSLLTYANSKTGESDTNLGEAVQRLIDGFGVGGSEQRVFTKVVDISDTFNVESTHITTAYEYHLQQLVPIDYLYIFDDSSNKYLWHFKVENTEQDVCYDSYIVSNGYTRGMTCMNNVKGEKSTSYLIYPEYRNSYGCMYRLIIGRSSVTVYEGTYDVNVSVYRIDDDVTEPEPFVYEFETTEDYIGSNTVFFPLSNSDFDPLWNPFAAGILSDSASSWDHVVIDTSIEYIGNPRTDMESYVVKTFYSAILYKDGNNGALCVANNLLHFFLMNDGNRIASTGYSEGSFSTSSIGSPSVQFRYRNFVKGRYRLTVKPITGVT